MAYVVMAHTVMAYIVMAYTVMAYIEMANIVMAHLVMAYIVMADTQDPAVGHYLNFATYAAIVFLPYNSFTIMFTELYGPTRAMHTRPCIGHTYVGHNYIAHEPCTRVPVRADLCVCVAA